MRRKSRLDGLVFFYHTGLEQGYAITGSFKVIPLRFQSKSLAKSIPPGWYKLKKRLGNKTVVIKSEDIVSLTDPELSEIAQRMKVRFGKLVSEVENTKKREITDNLIIVRLSDVPSVTEHMWYIYVEISNTVLTMDRIQRSRLCELAKKYGDEYVAVYNTDTYCGVIRFPSARQYPKASCTTCESPSLLYIPPNYTHLSVFSYFFSSTGVMDFPGDHR